MPEPSSTQIFELAKRFLACPSLSTPEKFAQVRANLPSFITESDPDITLGTLRQKMPTLIKTCLSFPRGLYELYAAVEFYDNGSKPFVALENFIFEPYRKYVAEQLDIVGEPVVLPFVRGKLNAAKDGTKRPSAFGKMMLSLINISPVSDTDTKELHNYSPQMVEGEQPVKLEDYFAEHKKLVLAGLPGAGKTTALCRLGLTLLQDPAATDLPPELADRLPVYVPLNTWNDPDQPLAEYIASRLVEAQPGLWVFAALLDGLLSTDRLLLLLDGLNEIPQLNYNKEGFIDDPRFQAIAALSDPQYTELICVTTCRQGDFVVNHYRKKKIAGWSYLIMQPLGEPEVRIFAEWFVTNYSLKYPERPINADLITKLIAGIVVSINRSINRQFSEVRPPRLSRLLRLWLLLR
jgi:hypothetical protein